MLTEERKEGGKARAGRNPRGCGGGRRARGRRKEGGRREADRWDPAVGAAVKKKKGRGERWAGAGMSWAAWAERSRAGFVFFLFFFQTSFSNHFSTLNQFKPFQTFLKNFIDFLETTQATKNHASQKMMHIHLLSLSLLNYL
jgi:hypothetical protein